MQFLTAGKLRVNCQGLKSATKIPAREPMTTMLRVAAAAPGVVSSAWLQRDSSTARLVKLT